MGNAKRKEEKKQQAILWDEDVLKAARRAVHDTPGLTLNQLVNNAVVREIKRLERQREEPFPKRKIALSPGRRVKLD